MAAGGSGNIDAVGCTVPDASRLPPVHLRHEVAPLRGGAT